MNYIVIAVLAYLAGVATTAFAYSLWPDTTPHISVTCEDGHAAVNVDGDSQSQVAVTRGENSPAINIRK